ncbi:MAG: kelch repeat-containing protein [Chitinophagaceae bacterium]
MKKILTAIFLLHALGLNAQITPNSQWTWMKGDSLSNVVGVYGTQGIASSNNKPGARSGAVSWTDASGNLWMFGGYFCATVNSDCGLRNDLWKYDISTNMWTWMKGDNTLINSRGVYGKQGIPASTNKPGPRVDAVSWTDALGNFWLFGGYGWASTTGDELNDLWKYDPANDMWTWMKGDSIITTASIFGFYGTQGIAASANNPPAREGAISWTDGINLWLFGGGTDYTSSINFFNDLWKYNPLTNEWTWMKGDIRLNSAGKYGAQGIAAPDNEPAARYGSVTWSDAAQGTGSLWMFGGFRFASPSNPSFSEQYYSDLWKYDLSSNQWTWMKGSDTQNLPGIYGTQGIPSAFTNPGGRIHSVAWKDNHGGFLIFAGYGKNAATWSDLNDLWKYDRLTNQWTWVKGDSALVHYGIYGAQGIASANNRPGDRENAVGWTDNFGSLWLLGGGGVAANSSGWLNDLWKLSNNSVLPLTLLKISAQSLQNTILVIWQTSNEANTTHFIVERSADGRNFLAIGSITAQGRSSATYDYLYTDQQPLQTTNFYRIKIVSSDARFTYSKVVAVKTNGKASLQIFPNPATDILYVQVNGINETAILEISDATGRKLKEEKIALNGSPSFSVDIKYLPKGIYQLLLRSSTAIQQGKFVKH